MRAAYDAGYRGKFFHFLTSDVGLLAPIFKPEVLEGYICSMTAMEYGDFNGCMTQLASDMKKAYIAKYGSWDYADYMTTPMYSLLMPPEKAGTPILQLWQMYCIKVFPLMYRMAL